MGHPGAENHDHHRSVWFAHADVSSGNFWADGQAPKVEQKMWFAYGDGDDEAVMAALMAWNDPVGSAVMEQEVRKAVTQVRRYAGKQVRRYAGTQVRKYPGKQVSRYPGTQVRWYAGAQERRYVATQLRRYPGNPGNRYPGTQVRR